MISTLIQEKLRGRAILLIFSGAAWVLMIADFVALGSSLRDYFGISYYFTIPLVGIVMVLTNVLCVGTCPNCGKRFSGRELFLFDFITAFRQKCGYCRISLWSKTKSLKK